MDSSAIVSLLENHQHFFNRYVLNTNGEDHHKNIAKTLIQTASKLNDAAKMHVTKKVLPVGISKVDDEKLLEEIRSRDEKNTHVEIAIEIHKAASALEDISQGDDNDDPPGLFQSTSSENVQSPSKSDADEVDDIERRLKHTTLVHAASSDKALQVFDSSSNDTAVGLPPGLRAPGLFDKILSSEDLADQNDDTEAKTLDTRFYTRILADNAASEDDVEQHIDDMISRPRVRSQDMTRERVDST